MDTEVGAQVSAAVTSIFEACGFQDITGQRITKVVTALQKIETKVDALLNAFGDDRSEEHTSELQSLMRISYAVFCLKTKNNNSTYDRQTNKSILVNSYK